MATDDATKDSVDGAGAERIIDCDRGHHAPLVEQPPLDDGTTVNVDSICPACGRLVESVSWKKAAWLKKHGGDDGIR